MTETTRPCRTVITRPQPDTYQPYCAICGWIGDPTGWRWTADHQARQHTGQPEPDTQHPDWATGPHRHQQ